MVSKSSVKFINYNEFISGVMAQAETLKKENEWRYGQAFFNVLFEERPDIAQAIHGSSLDPFFKHIISMETLEKIQELYLKEKK
jgi:hypothetical protein